ncbi:MAG: nucleoside-diphosphate sugar epimerase/dehydratase [Gammaproteobacteria bacterium]|nr:nucleoside-diphosphate sugar epimerase/dehydratase [Gammaproteobacteria bacterium]
MKTFVNIWLNRTLAITSDFLMIPLSWSGAFFLYSNVFSQPFPLQLLLILTLIQFGVFFICGLYRGIWRFASIPDLMRILRAVVIGSCVIYLYTLVGHYDLPVGLLLINSMLLILLLSGPRILFRWARDYRQFFTKDQRVLIVGAGSAGEGIVRDLLRLHNTKYHPIAFVDDNLIRQGREIHGVRVLGACQKIPELVKKLDINLILIAVPSASSIDMRRIVGYCEQTKIPFRTLPGLKDLADGTVSFGELRQVLLEDLLGREQAQLDWDQIRSVITHKTILVTGGGGSIGSELCRQIATKAPTCLIIMDNNEYNLYNIDMELRKSSPDLNLQCFLCSVTDRVGVRKIFEKYQPQLVFHTAAYKHVPLLEQQLCAAMYNNIIGTRIMSEAASTFKVQKFVLISTDKAVNPTNAMGATKRASEVFCQNMNFHSSTQFITVRFGNVLDSAGSVVPLFRKQLSEGGPLTVTHPEITRFFMTIPEATQLILQAASMGNGGEIFVLDMGEPIKIRYLAEQMIKLSGKILGDDIEIQYTGLRPGEKLYEELFHENEPLRTTSHQKIRQACVRRRDWLPLLNIIDEVEQACRQYDEKDLQALLYELVPEYKVRSLTANVA